jgi:hypothetical protein
LDEYELACRIAEIRSLIASDWPDVEERKRLYEELKSLEKALRELDTECKSSTNGYLNDR